MKILTFDIEEWFHILDYDGTKKFLSWSNFEVRIYENMFTILELLKKHNQKATFFCLGWIGKKYPDVVREIIKNGYEIGSHGFYHQLVYEQNQSEFRNDLELSIKTLEDITGKKVKYFRAPGFSIREDCLWAFEILYDYGIEVDCSIFPAQRAHGGFPSYTHSLPSVLKYKNIIMKEMPIGYMSVAGKSIIYSGGGYFRIFPYTLIKRWTTKSDYLMSYLHPRDFDAGQPRIRGLSVLRTFKSYVGIAGAMEKLERWISDFHFTDIKTAIEAIDWDTVPVVCISDTRDGLNS